MKTAGGTRHSGPKKITVPMVVVSAQCLSEDSLLGSMGYGTHRYTIEVSGIAGKIDVTREIYDAVREAWNFRKQAQVTLLLEVDP